VRKGSIAPRPALLRTLPASDRAGRLRGLTHPVGARNIRVMEAEFTEYIGRLVLALAIGGLLGVQREIEGKPAGMRINMLMGVGSCLLMILSIEISRATGTSADPTRIAAQIMTGIGFLGAGAILKSRLAVTGLTSAATIWFVAATGIAVGAGAYFLSLLATALVLLTLSLVGGFQYVIGAKQRLHILVFRFPTASNRMKQAKRLISALRIHVDDIEIKRENDLVVVEMEYVTSETKHRRALDALGALPDVEILVEY
jgi:putative Mg2+ transporter-C (MgtC) family protein